MSPVIAVNRARFPRSRLVTLSFVKLSICSHEKPGWPGYRDLGYVFATEISVTEMKIFPYEHYSPRVTGTELFRLNSFAFAT